jgi:hypothetical protein
MRGHQGEQPACRDLHLAVSVPDAEPHEEAGHAACRPGAHR